MRNTSASPLCDTYFLRFSENEIQIQLIETLFMPTNNQAQENLTYLAISPIHTQSMIYRFTNSQRHYYWRVLCAEPN